MRVWSFRVRRALEVPDDGSVAAMIATVRRPPSMSPTEELDAAVTWYPSVGDWAPRTEVAVELGLEELRHASASEVLAPGGRAQRVAAAFAAQTRAADQYSRLALSVWGTRIVDE